MSSLNLGGPDLLLLRAQSEGVLLTVLVRGVVIVDCILAVGISVVVEPSVGATKQCKLQPLAHSTRFYPLLELGLVVGKEMARDLVRATPSR